MGMKVLFLWRFQRFIFFLYRCFSVLESFIALLVLLNFFSLEFPPPQEQIHNPPYSGLYFSKSPLTFIPLRYKLKKKKYLYFCWKKNDFLGYYFFVLEKIKKIFTHMIFFASKCQFLCFCQVQTIFLLCRLRTGGPPLGRVWSDRRRVKTGTGWGGVSRTGG